MNIHDKINMRSNAFNYLTALQYMHILNRKLFALVPYYHERLLKQISVTPELMYGKTRYQHENNL